MPKPDIVGKPTKLPKPDKKVKVDEVLLAIAAAGGINAFSSIEDAVFYAGQLIEEVEGVLEAQAATPTTTG